MPELCVRHRFGAPRNGDVWPDPELPLAVVALDLKSALIEVVAFVGGVDTPAVWAFRPLAPGISRRTRHWTTIFIRGVVGF
jgi:hypothetical protein